jgi:hypothetical protein
MNKIIWYIKQLLPLTYRTHYHDERGFRHFCVWNMWFGRSFNIDDVIIG